MKRVFHALLLASLLFVSCAASGPQVSPVQPLRVNGNTFCTAFSINEKDGYWATAGHCAQSMLMYKAVGALLETPMDLSLGAGYVEIAYVDSYVDIAVLRSSLHVKPLKLASERLQQNEAISVWGFPYGLNGLVITNGTVAAVDMPIDGISMSTLLDITVAGGNSGSPVLKNGQIVGVLFARFNDSMLSLATPQTETQRVLKPYVR